MTNPTPTDRWLAYVKSGKRAPLPGLTVKEAEQLQREGHTVHITPPHDGIRHAYVDGHKRFRITP